MQATVRGWQLTDDGRLGTGERSQAGGSACIQATKGDSRGRSLPLNRRLGPLLARSVLLLPLRSSTPFAPLRPSRPQGPLQISSRLHRPHRQLIALIAGRSPSAALAFAPLRPHASPLSRLKELVLPFPFAPFAPLRLIALNIAPSTAVTPPAAHLPFNGPLQHPPPFASTRGVCSPGPLRPTRPRPSRRSARR